MAEWNSNNNNNNNNDNSSHNNECQNAWLISEWLSEYQHALWNIVNMTEWISECIMRYK